MTTTAKHIYLDHNATTPISPQAAEAVARAYAAGLANPASQHWAGRKARQVLENAREAIAAILGAEVVSSQCDKLIFTSGGTEANNLAIFGLLGPSPAHAVVSAIEHPSVIGPCDHLRRLGWQIDLLPVSAHGVVEVDRLAGLLRPDTRLVSIMMANNETGVLQPVERAAQICAARGVPLHTDAVQAAGKVPVDFRRLGIAALSVSGHKFHGPPGIGALLVRQGVTIAPHTFGGFQQAGVRPGTESVALAAGMQAALEHWSRDADAARARMTALRDEFEAALRAGCPDLIVNGTHAERLPQTCNVSFPGVDRKKMVMALDLAGIACATGSACASGSSEPSPVLVAMGCPRVVLEGSLRFSFGAETTRQELLDAAGRIVKICNELRTGKSGQKMAFAGRGPKPILVD